MPLGLQLYLSLLVDEEEGIVQLPLERSEEASRDGLAVVTC